MPTIMGKILPATIVVVQMSEGIVPRDVCAMGGVVPGPWMLEPERTLLFECLMLCSGVEVKLAGTVLLIYIGFELLKAGFGLLLVDAELAFLLLSMYVPLDKYILQNSREI